MPDPEIPFPKVHPRDDGIRPAGLPNACFYCGEPIGKPHRFKCVAVTKTVRLRFVVEIESEQPFSWSDEQIKEYEEHEGYCLEDLKMSAVLSCEVVGAVDAQPRIKIWT